MSKDISKHIILKDRRMKNTKEITKKRLVLMTIAAMGVLLLTACNPALPLNPRYAYSKVEINLGDEIQTDLEEYIDFTELNSEERTFVEENTEVLLDGKEAHGESISDTGEHTLVIMYCGRQYRSYNIRIVDKEAPEFTKAKNLYTFKGLDIDDATIDLMFEAKDNSGRCDIDIESDDIDFSKVGTYEVKAVATDPSGNQSTAEAKVVVQEPKYGAKGTYVYVSIADQTLTYFVDGKVDLTTPVVTGNTNGHNTPRGTHRINSKARNITLKGREDNGDEYESFVNYWMAFLGYSYGLHDATWRGSFGGQIYMGGGSHGCVNMPLGMAATLYDKIAIGTPVLIY